jgi:hypothetical protein
LSFLLFSIFHQVKIKHQPESNFWHHEPLAHGNPPQTTTSYHCCCHHSQLQTCLHINWQNKGEHYAPCENPLSTPGT